jgi:predicted pyridoxine 5'-phosphate oxidase superfamily flavin-nucleotide-binding protein
MYRPLAPITTAAEVKAILGSIHPSQIAKVIDHIDEHCAKWIERCPFIVISSINAAGPMDISPKGDPPGFVKVLDKQTREPLRVCRRPSCLSHAAMAVSFSMAK